MGRLITKRSLARCSVAVNLSPIGISILLAQRPEPLVAFELEPGNLGTSMISKSQEETEVSLNLEEQGLEARMMRSS